MYGNLPSTGLNLSLPIYLFVGLLLLIVSGVMFTVNKIRG